MNYGDVWAPVSIVRFRVWPMGFGLGGHAVLGFYVEFECGLSLLICL